MLAVDDDTATATVEVVDLASIVEEQVAERTFTSGGGPQFSVAVATTAPVHGSEIQLGRIVRNLLDNAARHARSVVEVTVAWETGDIVLTVSDDGSGVPAFERERIFERFVRLDEARSRATCGSGLGLAIVRGLVTRLGGRVWVVRGSAGGASFVVRLPAATSTAPAG
jgi:signal transduction histidine kinase